MEQTILDMEPEIEIPVGLDWLAKILTVSTMEDDAVHKYAISFIKTNSVDDEGWQMAERLNSYTVDELRSSLISSMLQHAITTLGDEEAAFLVRFRMVGLTPITTIDRMSTTLAT